MSDAIKELFAQPTFERALLSYCMKSTDNYYTIAAAVSDDDFLRPEHRLIFVIIGTLIRRDVSSFDGALIAHEADKNGVLKQVGGYEYIDALLSAELSTSFSNLSHYIRSVLEASTKYKIRQTLDKCVRDLEKEGLDEDIEADGYINTVEGSLMDISSASKSIVEARNLADGLDELIEHRKNNPVEFIGIPTGFEILDKRIEGLVPGTLQIISARPKHGKSTMLSCIAKHIAYYGDRVPILYVDTEMPFDQWRDRMISMMAEIDERVVQKGGYNDSEYRSIKKAAEIIKKGKLFHEFMPGYSVDKLVAVYKKYKYKENIGLAVFDYIKEPSKSSSGDVNRKEYQLLGDVTTALKDLAGELNIPVLAASQLNREGKIADSDRLLRYADVLMRLHPLTDEELKKIHPYQAKYGTFKLVITDSRRGGTTPQEGIGLIFRKRILRIYEAPEQLNNYDSEEFLEKEEMSDGSSMYDDKNSKTNESTNETVEDF